ncbi:MAG: DNA-binding protein, partial [Oscillospiraceae bacterium]|nr:DNA-binding protein [Oscillospiraceae bacterium]
MYHCFRLTRGQDLYRAIEDYAKDHHIAAGAVVSGVGCVSRWEVRDASGVTVQSGTEDVEIVSLTGTVSDSGCH